MQCVFGMVHWIIWVLMFDTLQRALCQCSGSPLTLVANETVSMFTSPGYPTAYANDLYCEWLLDSGVAGQPVLLYSDHYDMDCPLGDYIDIYDGSSTSNTSLASSICGSDLATVVYISTGQHVLVTFSSNSADVNQGFQMTYISSADTSGTGCTAEYHLTASSSTQYLTSNNFPSKYDSDSACRWLITAPGSLSTIQVELTWSDIESDPDCKYDELVIYTGSYVCEESLLFANCTDRTSAGTTPTVYTSTTNSVLVILSSDNSYNRYGFILKYTATIAYTTTTPTPPITAAGGTSGPVTNTVTVTETNIPLMIVSAISGAGFVLIIVATVVLVRYLKNSKRHKKGLRTVQSIAPLPSRQAAYPGRPPTNHVLSFV